MPKARSLLLSAMFGLLACHPEPTNSPTDEDQAIPAPARPSVEVDEMMRSIEWLASDERRGRYTLDPEISVVSAWIAGRYAELGLAPAPGADAHTVPYTLRTGAKAGDEQRLAVIRDGETIEVAGQSFSPRVEGSSGAVTAELVFVGYGVQWTRDQDAGASERAGEEDKDGEPSPLAAIDSYDDLAGVDLDGKIALVLAHAPNTPDLMALFAAMQSLSEEFEVEAAPLREADELKKLDKLHREARETLLDYVEPFVDTSELGDSFWEVSDPKAPLNTMALASVLAEQDDGRPRFELGTLDYASKVEALAEAGALGVVFVQGPRSFIGSEAREADALPGLTGGGGHLSNDRVRVLPAPAPIPVVQLRWKQADKLFRIDGNKLSKVQAAIDKDYQPRSRALGVELALETSVELTTVEVPNVLAQIPGQTDEVILLGAHFDHIGDDVTGQCRAIVRRDSRDTICNGADDNASGTAMLLELARAYVEAGLKPERTIVFAHFSGEELGLLGSDALFDDPPFDQAKVAAMVNLDMVGRLGPRGLAIGGIGSSDEWMPLLDELGNRGMEVLYEGSTTTRSDHAHWFRAQIPVLFFFTGVHGDYHRAGDEIDEINVEGLASIGQLVSDLVWELADGRAIAWSGLGEGEGIGRGLPGSDPSTVIRRVDEDGSLIEAEE